MKLQVRGRIIVGLDEVDVEQALINSSIKNTKSQNLIVAAEARKRAEKVWEHLTLQSCHIAPDGTARVIFKTESHFIGVE